MPKKRKADGDAKESPEKPLTPNVEVKTEVLSQDQPKENCSEGEEQEKEEVNEKRCRNLRPRKSTCYAERESPEPEIEEKSKKTPRRKRRVVVLDETETSENKENEAVPKSDKPLDKDIISRQPTLVSCEAANSQKKTKKVNGTAESTASDGTKEKAVGDRKRKRKPNLTPSVDPSSEGKLVPKTEPVSPQSIDGETEKAASTVDQKKIQSTEKPKPKKRVRPKKPSTETKSTGSVVNKDAEGGENEKKPNENSEVKDSNVEKKKSVKKKVTDSDGVKEPLVEENEADKSEELSAKKPAPARRRAKPRPRPKKTEEEENPDANTEVDGEGGDASVKPEAPAGPTHRKPFFRGRRAKSTSARAGRKEIVHKDEPIDPEDIKGFEHVEKYVTPEGMRLAKFWDSEDELSEDENNDNFRRIMCGFGTNCRIHEVIRPASEIVRRLKELQNTFGTTKSLPLFQKDASDLQDPLGTLSTEQGPRKERTITWHTDPGFFKFANNYPSRWK